MSSQIRIAARLAGAILLLGLAIFCGYGFLASFEMPFPNGGHALYGIIGVSALAWAVWLILPALKPMLMGNADPHWASYWRTSRLAALFSLFSVTAFMTGNFTYLAFLLFLLFLVPGHAKARAQS